MLLHIVARGRIGRSPEAELVERYLKRVAWPTRVTELPDTGGKMPDRWKGHPHRHARRDRRERCPRARWRRRLGAWRDDGVRETRFLIGAADGFDDAQRSPGRPAASPSAARPGRT
jgi:23S rRNA (pseudouridine1915-N3)-methyltransferase